MDVLTEILASLRLNGGIVFDAEMRGDWCAVSQYSPEHCAPYFPVPQQVISYHYVRRGRMFVELPGLEPVRVAEGTMVLCPRNDPHLIYSRPGLAPKDLAHVTKAGDGTSPSVIRMDQGGDETALFCGWLGVLSDHHPLLEALPPLLVIEGESGATSDWMTNSLRYAASELQHDAALVAKLSEVFFAQAVRRYVERLGRGEGGWLAGLRDPAVSKALSIIHSRFAEDLTIEGLARGAGVSRSVLGERFVELLGEPPMRYCARWRMRVAANMLREGKDSTANIAYSVGFNSEAAFNRAFKREFGAPPATWRRSVESELRRKAEALRPASKLPAQQVLYCTAKDGTRLAYSKVGEGPPLLKTANWLNHIEFDWESPLWRHWTRELTQRHCLIRYDERGNGLSDWDTPEISFEAFVLDLETVVDCCELEQFDLLGISQGAAVSIAYALKHPGRIRKMVLCGGYAAGWAARAMRNETAIREAMITLTEKGWGSDNPAYRQLFTTLYIPRGTAEQAAWFTELQRVSASPANAVRLQRTLSQIDVRALLPQVDVPTLIFHARGDQVVPFEAGQYLASKLPNATFIPLESDNHILLEHEPAWRMFVSEMRSFLGADFAAELAPAA